jgi:heme/copper-type cytochrome/quinol oxidase subunit 2
MLITIIIMIIIIIIIIIIMIIIIITISTDASKDNAGCTIRQQTHGRDRLAKGIVGRTAEIEAAHVFIEICTPLKEGGRLRSSGRALTRLKYC